MVAEAAADDTFVSLLFVPSSDGEVVVSALN